MVANVSGEVALILASRHTMANGEKMPKHVKKKRNFLLRAHARGCPTASESWECWLIVSSIGEWWSVMSVVKLLLL